MRGKALALIMQLSLMGSVLCLLLSFIHRDESWGLGTRLGSMLEMYVHPENTPKSHFWR